MEAPLADDGKSAKLQPMPTETYTPGFTPHVLAYMQRRRAETHAAFFTPLLKPGFALLDCGCGPGSITLGLARCVAPGRVVAIDQVDAQFAGARAEAERQGLPIEFRSASIYELPFPEASFDAVFSHALFEHLSRPLDALKEIHRVLKPGGFVGLRSPDWAGNLFYPDLPELRQIVALFQDLQNTNGGDTQAGRKLGAHLRSSGFARVGLSASYEIYPEASLITEIMFQGLAKTAPPGQAPEEMARLTRIVRDWEGHPDAFFAQAWVEAVGWKA